MKALGSLLVLFHKILWVCSCTRNSLNYLFLNILRHVRTSYEPWWILLFCCQVLFNDTVYHNIHYGRLSATEEEVLYVKSPFFISLTIQTLCNISIWCLRLGVWCSSEGLNPRYYHEVPGELFNCGGGKRT